MDTRGYFERVLPPKGYYAVLVISADKRRQQFFNNFNDLESAVRKFDAAGLNTYVAVNSFREGNKRTQENVLECRAFYMDIDCGEGKPYADQASGAKALLRFLKATGLPQPVIVSSGRGLHVYWVLDEAIDPQRWKLIADGLKQAAASHKFAIDMAVPGDSARVLRPTGTRNHKGEKPLPVRLLRDAPNVALDQLTSVIGPSKAMPLVTPTPRVSALAKNLAVTTDFPPAVAHVLVAKCQQLSWMVTNQDKVEEPLWYAMLGVAAHCESPELVAVEWSNKHPKFNYNHTLGKLRQWQSKTTGPTLCKKLEDLRPGGCKGCIFKEKIASPCALGIQYAEVEVTAEAADIVHPHYQLKPPKPYKRTAKGMMMTIDDTDVTVFNHDIFPVSYGKDEGKGHEVVNFMWSRPHHGWWPLNLSNAHMFEGSREFTKELGEQGVPGMSSKQQTVFQMMLRQYMDELRAQQAMTNQYNTMGWKNDDAQFLLGNRLYQRGDDGDCTVTDISASKTTRRTMEVAYTMKGDLKSWVALTEVMAKADLFAHQFALLVSLSTPFYEFTGLRGMTLSLYGPTGTGKTLAQYWMQSIWGDPMQLHSSSKFTPNALYAKMALYNNLPVTVDETTMLSGQELGDMLYNVSQGRDKSRLDRTAVEREPKTWGTTMTISSNRSTAGALASTGLDTEAQLARLLEITVPQSGLFAQGTDTGRKIYQVLAGHHGHAGDVFMRELLKMGAGNVKQIIASATSTFSARYKARFSGHERYWEQMVVLADVGGKIAARLGLIKFDHEAAINWVLEQLGTARISIASTRTTCFDYVSEYLSSHVGSIITVMHTKGQTPVMDHQMTVRGELRARYDVYRDAPGDKFDKGTLTLDRRMFRDWLFQRNGDFRAFLTELAASNADATPKSSKAVIGRDTPYKLGQVYVIGINLTHPEMQNTLNNLDTSLVNIQPGQLKVVS